jgi:c-di-GMP-binding flagellar brake protein YcgR
MLERTFSIWRRLLGKPRETVAMNQPDERRNWIRYPSDLETKVRRADLSADKALPARIRDISRGGANLLVDGEFQTGQMLSIELTRQGEDGPESVDLLACIVRCQTEPSGKRSLGCIFSRELTDADLARFGARRLRHSAEDQRTWRRFDVHVQAAFQKVGESDERRYAGTILNISASGVGLEVEQPVLPGSLLNLELGGTNNRNSKTILACVVHAARKGDTNWALGCNFIRELNEAEFQEMV